MIEPRPHAHCVVPRNRKRPPNQSAQNSLTDGERNDVALAGKEPRHSGSPDEGKRNQHGIWPVDHCKNCACKQRGRRWAACRSKQPVRQIGIQTHLLEQAKGHVSKKMPGNEEMLHGAMQRAEQDSREAKSTDARSENDGGTFCGGP